MVIKRGGVPKERGEEAFRSPEEILKASVHKSSVSFAQIKLNFYLK